MSNVKLNDNEKMIKERIENYTMNCEELYKLKEKYEKYKDCNSNSTAKYSIAVSFGSFNSSKVENIAFNKIILEEQIKNIEQEIKDLDYAINKLKPMQFEIIKLMILGNTMKEISIKLKNKRKKTEALRKVALKNIYSNIYENDNTL